MKILRLLAVLLIALLIFSCDDKPTELIQIDNPIFTPVSGTYLSGQAITITCPEFGATIRYTVDGTDPTELSPTYTTPLQIPIFFPTGTTTCTLKAKAWKTGFDPSQIVSATYTVTYFNTVSIPHFSPLSGTITSATEIGIYCSTLNAAIHYTLDGTDPTEASPLYTEVFTIAQTGEVNLKARAFRPNWNPSEIASTTYTVSAK